MNKPTTRYSARVCHPVRVQVRSMHTSTLFFSWDRPLISIEGYIPPIPSKTKQCTNCKKSESDPEQPLKPCNKCHSVQYCDRDCQKADFKQHKKECAKEAQIYARNANVNMATSSRPPKDGHRGGLQKWQFDTWDRCAVMHYKSLIYRTSRLGIPRSRAQRQHRFIAICVCYLQMRFLQTDK